MTGAAITATDCDSLLDALRARQNQLNLSDAMIDSLGGLTPGHCNKILGVGREKPLGHMSLDVLLEVLAVSLVVVDDPAKLERMARRYEERDLRRVHYPKTRISRNQMKRVFKHIGQKGAQTRMVMLSAEHRSQIGRNAAEARWKQHRRRKRQKRVRAVRRTSNSESGGAACQAQLQPVQSGRTRISDRTLLANAALSR